MLASARGSRVIAIDLDDDPEAAQAGLNGTAVWGRVCMVGIGGKISLETRVLLDRQITAMTSYTMSTVGQKDCADFVLSLRLDLDRLFTHRWKLDQAEAAYHVLDAQSSGKGVFLF